MTEHDLHRFQSKTAISLSGCIEWTGRLNEHGYGIFVIGHSRAFLAHRVAYEHWIGEIPSGICVLHRCDNPRCVNPEHLWLGTQRDNIKDMVDKGRNRSIPQCGESNPCAKLSIPQVYDIRSRYVPRKVTMRQLAKEFGVRESTICLIVHGHRWAETN